MQIVLTKHFKKISLKLGIDHQELRQAIHRAEAGLIDADLGGLIIKQRIARQGSGRSGGHRAIIMYRRGTRAFFLHFFSKNRQANLSQEELGEYQALARELDKLTDHALTTFAVKHGWEILEDDERKEDISE